MANRTARREEALRSALDRLNVPMMICDENQILQPLNGRATALFEAENLRGDLLTARPSHPLSRLIADILRSEVPGEVIRRMVTFPSGKRYTVESSGRSQKGLQRWLVLLLEPFREISVDEQSALERWPLTERERDVAKLVVRGLSNDGIAREIGISPETVKTHVRSIFEKSGTHSRAEFLAAVLRSR
jgi:DNA-binding CsgD family transcriptional regulator